MKSVPDPRILIYLRAQGIITLATSAEGRPHCAICFYAFQEEGNKLIFKSGRDSLHIRQALMNERVAGTITSEENDVKKLKGIQFEGRFTAPDAATLENVRKIYYNKYPFARIFPGDLWTIELEKIKMTDNSFGFGKKLLWEKISKGS